jgi:hypothetical protein
MPINPESTSVRRALLPRLETRLRTRWCDSAFEFAVVRLGPEPSGPFGATIGRAVEDDAPCRDRSLWYAAPDIDAGAAHIAQDREVKGGLGMLDIRRSLAAPQAMRGNGIRFPVWPNGYRDCE